MRAIYTCTCSNNNKAVKYRIREMRAIYTCSHNNKEFMNIEV